MCYAIPGEVVNIKDKIITIEYFGEKKTARNEFYSLKIGEYVYAQGGFIVQRIGKENAISILKTWEGLFSKLKERDLNLTREPKSLYQIANAARQKHLGNSCCVHGIINFSNFCRNDCLYCGIRKSNLKLPRYRMEIDEIVDRCDYAANKLGFKAIVLQSGEDLWYNNKKLIELVSKIRKKCGILLILSIGERGLDTYKNIYKEGARGALIRFETSREDLYKRFKPESDFNKRIGLIRNLYSIGYLVMTGFLIGLPGETEQDLLENIRLTNSLNSEMFSFGPFIPHYDTPLKDAPTPSLEAALTAIARARILYPESKILVTTALETLDKKDGAKRGLMAGGNSLMIDLTPKKYSSLYSIYPDRKGTENDIDSRIEEVKNLLHSIGRAPTDLGL